MEATKILQADLIDILFENRNKDYGAYNLRKTYNRRITTALLMTVSAAAIVFILFNIAYSRGQNNAMLEVREWVLENIPQDKPEKNIEPPPPQPQKVETPTIERIRLTPPKIVSDNEVNKEDIPPEVSQLADAKIDVVNVAGTKDMNIATPPVIDDYKRVVEAPKPQEDNTIFEKVEIEASFPGGLGAWARYLHKTLNSTTPVDNGAPAGTYTVLIKFVVDREGNISDVTPLTNYGYGMEEEAIRAIKNGPNWTPAIQNGNKVNAYRKQPVTFIIPEE